MAGFSGLRLWMDRLRPLVEIERTSWQIAQGELSMRMNLVDNALKYTPLEGRIELLAHNAPHHTVALAINDTGQGIAPEALPHVFDRFYRADPAHSRSSGRTGGSGLGLAIAKELVEAQHGTIAISSALGEGTSVALRFPALYGE